MDAALLTLVVVALAAATGFAAVAWRSVDEQRRRSAARVAALSAALEAEQSRLKPAPTLELKPAPMEQSRLKPAPTPELKPAPTPEFELALTTDAPIPTPVVGAGFSRLDARRDAPVEPVAVGSLFATASGAAVQSRPMIKAAVMAGMAVALTIFVAAATRGGPEPAPVADTAAPLELISMRHARDGRTLTVSGLVRNPRAGATVGSVSAVVLAFDRQGTFLATANAPLDFLSLAPGDESPFVVSLPNVGEVGRYRVSFRTDAGVVRHVDRRAAQVAVNASVN